MCGEGRWDRREQKKKKENRGRWLFTHYYTTYICSIPHANAEAMTTFSTIFWPLSDCGCTLADPRRTCEHLSSVAADRFYDPFFCAPQKRLLFLLFFAVVLRTKPIHTLCICVWCVCVYRRRVAANTYNTAIVALE